ncbi:hypothetical protein RUND412_002083 [Rhizina undulata]
MLRRIFLRISRNSPIVSRIPRPRCFTTTHISSYEGVYKELQTMRLQKPYLQALAQKRAGIVPDTSEGKNATGERQLTPKRMSDSYHKLILPLAHNEWLVDGYVNATGQLRLGSLFQDLDALAGAIAYKHSGPGPTIATAAVDRISIINPLESFCDLELSGHVSYIGTSSMETEGVKGDEGLLLTCAFTMVALDPATKKRRPIPINPLIVETPEEKAIFQWGEEYKQSKKTLAKTSLDKQTPNQEEANLIHKLYLEQKQYQDNALAKPSDTIYMSETVIHSTQIMQPQYRNLHSFMILGGYLMKQTTELAFCCCSAFAHSRPTFLSLDPSTFEAPVPVGSILYLTATVAYTEEVPGEKDGEIIGSRVQVTVESKVRDVEHGKEVNTGVFNYTLFVQKQLKVMLVAYSKFIKFIDARRRAKQQAMVKGTDDGTTKRVTE